MTTVEELLFRGYSAEQDLLLWGLLPAQSALWVCDLWRWLAGALVWLDICHQVCWFQDFGEGLCCVPRSVLPMSCPGPLGMSFKVICRWQPLIWAWWCLGEAKLQMQARSFYCQAWGSSPKGVGHAEATCCLFGVCELLRDFSKVQIMSRPGNGLGGSASWVGQGLRWHLCKVKGVRQVDTCPNY